MDKHLGNVVELLNNGIYISKESLEVKHKIILSIFKINRYLFKCLNSYDELARFIYIKNVIQSIGGFDYKLLNTFYSNLEKCKIYLHDNINLFNKAKKMGLNNVHNDYQICSENTYDISVISIEEYTKIHFDLSKNCGTIILYSYTSMCVGPILFCNNKYRLDELMDTKNKVAKCLLINEFVDAFILHCIFHLSSQVYMHTFESLGLPIGAYFTFEYPSLRLKKSNVFIV